MTYATVADIQSRMSRTLTQEEVNVCTALLEDAAAMIDAVASGASEDLKRTVSCRMVIRSLGDGSSGGYPIGAIQGSMSGLGYSQSWTVGSGGSVGELYLSKQDKLILGVSNHIGSHSPLEDMTCAELQ